MMGYLQREGVRGLLVVQQPAVAEQCEQGSATDVVVPFVWLGVTLLHEQGLHDKIE